MRDVAVVGVGMLPFGKWPDRNLKDLSRGPVTDALADAGLDIGDVQMAVVGNAVAGLMTGQEQVRAQVILRSLGFGRIPMVNTENACASSSTAVHLGWLYVASGMVDVALVLGVEKLYDVERERTFRAIGSAVDIETIDQLFEQEGVSGVGGSARDRSVFMDLYAARVTDYMQNADVTPSDFAMVSVKSHDCAALNPYAQYRKRFTVEEVLASPVVVPPLTRLMCSPVGDGAAAVVLASPEIARRLDTTPIWVAASVLSSGWDREPDDPKAAEYAASRAYEVAGIGPADVDVVELHDATAPAELMHCESLGFCSPGEGVKLLRDGTTSLSGALPVNPSGGLLSRGHPIGATGAAQIVELTWQLRGQCGDRQVRGGRAKVALAHNGGGNVGGEPGAVVVHLLKK